MNDNEALPPRAVPTAHRRAVALTHVELTWIEKRIEHWLRFGRRAEEKILDRRRSIRSPRSSAASPSQTCCASCWRESSPLTPESRHE
ncbi:hypothetical protein AB7M43_003618 [Bradyrhizobium elkanii]